MCTEDIFEKVISSYQKLTKAEAKLADYVLRHKQDIQHMLISELALASGISEATVTRFCRTIGCGGFPEFKREIVRALTANARPVMGREDEDLYGEVLAEDTIEQKCQKLHAIGVKALSQTLSSLDPKAIEKAVGLMCQARNIYCFGQGNSSIVAMSAWGRFAAVTAKFHWIPDSHMQAYTASILRENDVVLYFSFSGATRELCEIGSLIRNTKAKLILVTRYPNAPGTAYADLLLICGANESPRQQGSIAAKIGQLFIIDVLFNEFCAQNLDEIVKNKETTLSATANMMLHKDGGVK